MKVPGAVFLLSGAIFLAGCEDGNRRQLENEMILM